MLTGIFITVEAKDQHRGGAHRKLEAHESDHLLPSGAADTHETSPPESLSDDAC